MALKHYFIPDVYEDKLKKLDTKVAIQFCELPESENIVIIIRNKEGQDNSIIVPLKEVEQAIEWLKGLK